MDGPDTGSEIVHTGLRNSSVNKGRNEVMLKEHIYQMKEAFVFVAFVFFFFFFSGFYFLFLFLFFFFFNFILFLNFT